MRALQGITNLLHETSFGIDPAVQLGRERPRDPMQRLRGRLEGDAVRCMYHGIKYDSSGKCIQIPGQDMIPPKLQRRIKRSTRASRRCQSPIVKDTLPNFSTLNLTNWFAEIPSAAVAAPAITMSPGESCSPCISTSRAAATSA
jgi:hypothetical protein